MTPLTEALKRLMGSDHPLNVSAFSTNQRKQLEQFAQNTRLIEISRQGRGTVYRIVNRQSLIDYLRVQHPIDEDALPAGLPARSRNIGMERSSKRGLSGHACCYLLMKAWDAETVWQSGNDALHPARLTERFGVSALRIEAGSDWQCSRPLLLVENQALFDRCDWLPDDFNGCLIYYAGQISDVLLHWFSERKRSDHAILFPDYDGIGLSNYARLAEALHPGTKLDFYWLQDWETKLAAFGNAEIWKKTRVQFENAFTKLNTMDKLDDELRMLGSLSQRYGKVLEQEAVWL